MSDNNAKIRISLKDGEFELSGSELFVSQQITSFRELIVESLQKQKFELITPQTQSQPQQLQSPINQVSTGDSQENNEIKTAANFSRVFHVDNGGIRIIKRAPGNNNAHKSVNTALMYVWAKSSMGQEEVAFNEIRDLCKSQGCLDSSNFAAHMKSAKEEMVIQGKGKFAKAKLTIPGLERALAIIEDLNSK